MVGATNRRSTSQVISTPLGINPGGRFNNAVDISAKNSLSHVQSENPALVRHQKFRWRQTASDKSFHKIGGTWKQVHHSIGSQPDDPDPGLQTAQDERGWMRMFDSPGWPLQVVPSTRTLDMGGGKKSDAQAVEVVVKMMLQTWVEGQLSSGAWERVSHEIFEWCSVQWLKRANANADWQTTSGCKVVPGRDAMSEYARDPEDVVI